MKGVYIGQTGCLDGLTVGKEYELFELNDTQYLIKQNECGGSSEIKKEKFEITEK